MAKRYSKLPSEILGSGDTLDLRIAMTAMEYETWRERKTQKGHTPTHHSQEYLQERIDAVRAQNGHSRQK
jgi:hypothetical protein